MKIQCSQCGKWMNDSGKVYPCKEAKNYVCENEKCEYHRADTHFFDEPAENLRIQDKYVVCEDATGKSKFGKKYVYQKNNDKWIIRKMKEVYREAIKNKNWELCTAINPFHSFYCPPVPND